MLPVAPDGQDNFGFFPVHQAYHWPYPPKKFTVDIIAIHGITGDAFSTWQWEDGTLWLRDFLSYDLPGARIFSYGYDAKVFFGTANAGYDESARTLLDHITQSRYGEVKESCHESYCRYLLTVIRGK